MPVTTEGTFATQDGTKLYQKSWTPDSGKPTAVLVFVHGFSDHVNAYYDFFPILSSPPHDIAVYAFDQRGWGRSVTKPAEMGLTGPTSLVLSDIHDFIVHVASLPDAKGCPLFLMGHSMGGQESFQYLLSAASPFSKASNRPQISGLLLEAPYIELDPSEQPSFLKVFAGKLAAFVLPTNQLKQKLDPTHMSRSAQVRDEWVNDKLCHDTGTLEGLKGMLQRSGDLSSLSHGRSVPGLLSTLPCPMWLGHGTSDKVVSPEASKRLFDVLKAPNGDKVYRSYPDAYHKLHAEPDGVGEQVAKDVAEWIISHIDKQPAGIQSTISPAGEVKAKL